MDQDVQSVMNSFRRIMRVLRAATKASEAGLKVRTAQLYVLHQLKLHEPLSLNQLAAHTYSHQSTVSVVVNDLVRKGFVRRARAPDDGRRLVLALTPAGRAIVKKQRLTIQEKFAAALGKLTPKRRRALAELLTEFGVHAGISGQQPHFFFENEKPPRRPK